MHDGAPSKTVWMTAFWTCPTSRPYTVSTLALRSAGKQRTDELERSFEDKAQVCMTSLF